MIAKIIKDNDRLIAQYERTYQQTKDKVWSAITENDRLQKWMNHLEIVNLKKDGLIYFHYNDGSGQKEEIKITDFQDGSAIEFEWGQDTVRFEVVQNDNGAQLTMKEFINKVTDHTPKDLAGWHVCIMHLSNVINDESNEIPENEWEKWFEEYKALVEKYKQS